MRGSTIGRRRRRARLLLHNPLGAFRFEGIGDLDAAGRSPFRADAGNRFSLFIVEIDAHHLDVHRGGNHVVPFG